MPGENVWLGRCKVQQELSRSGLVFKLSEVVDCGVGACAPCACGLVCPAVATGMRAGRCDNGTSEE